MNQKIVCITGASRGIGLALTGIYLKNGHRVLAVSRKADKMVVEAGDENNLIRIPADLTSDKGIAAVAEKVDEAGEVNVLIHNAGLLVYKPFNEISSAELKKAYEVNVFAPFLLTQALFSRMQRCHVINISSVGGVEGSLKFAGLSAYSSSKAALNCLTQMWAEEFKDTEHTFNCLALGSVDTEMFHEAFPGVRASCTPEVMAAYIYEFEKYAPNVQGGKIISVSRGNP